MKLKMKKIRFGYIAVVLLVITTNCSKEKQTLLESVWVVNYLQEDANITNRIYFADIHSLSFIGDDKYVFQTPEGDCIIGNVKIESNNKIRFERILTKFNNLFTDSFSCSLENINCYEVDADHLILRGNNGLKIGFMPKTIF